MTAPVEHAEEGGGPSGAPVQLVLLLTGGHRFAVPILDVREVLQRREFTRLPGRDAVVLGLMNARGRIITVLDFGIALGLGPVPESEENRIVVLDDGSRLAGLLVERVAGIEEVVEEAVDFSREAVAVFPVDQPYLAGVGGPEGEPFAVLDVERLLERWFR